MSDGEGVMLFACVCFAAVVWLRFGYRLIAVNSRITRRSGLGVWITCTAAVALSNLPVLLLLSSSDVRTAPEYVAFYLIMAYAAAAGYLCLLWLMGWQSADVTQRGNHAAAVYAEGVVLAGSLAFAGANIGDGPSFAVVIFCAALSGSMVASAMLMHWTCGRSGRQILIERDRPFAFRVACLLAAVGLIAGRSVSGDWHSVTGTLDDFVASVWPAPLLVLADILLARYRPLPRPGANPAGQILLGMVYLALAAAYLVYLGVPQ